MVVWCLPWTSAARDTATPHLSGTLNEKPVSPEILDAAVTTFCGMIRWDPETGKPTEVKLNELDIAWVGESS